MNFLIDFSFIVSGVTVKDPQYIIPHYITDWNEQSFSNLNLNVDRINNDILKSNGCVFVSKTYGDEYTIGNIELQNFAIIQSTSDNEDTNKNADALEIDQITHQKQFEQKLLRWFAALEHVKCYRKGSGRRILFTSEQANNLIHTTDFNTKRNETPQKDIDSYSLRQINELRKAEGMDSWQTELANNLEPFGIDSAKFNSRLVTYAPKFGVPKMTKYSTIRRLLKDTINNNTDSYLVSLLLSSFTRMIVIIAIICIISAVFCLKMLKQRIQSKSQEYVLMPIPTSPESIEVLVI